ncbi:hypothetical protein [Aliiroseovarius sp. 2305UL8-7]|uniref:hypothetical protein n=1 Tax=Aliiroseovarius conchicola TaxID=3121637 RepID=UPI0035294D59
MSDPVSNAEIEDVLSSIRRLISESNTPSGPDASAKADKLVLTPAFRVHDDEAAPKVPPKASASTPVSRVEDAAPAADISVVPDDTTPVFSHRGYSKAPVEDAEELPLKTDDARPTTGARTGPIDVAEEKISDRFDSWEPDEGEETTASDVLKFHAARLNADRPDGSEPIVGEADIQAWPSDKPVPDAPYVDVQNEDSADEAIVLTPTDQTQPTLRNLPSKSVEIVGEDTDIIDEEVVQAMVARLVREELQGEVGEKITQSIRRFVRREIERAITLKGLE